MSRIDVNYQTAMSRHPELVAEIVGKLRSSTSQNKNVTQEQMRWGYDWGEFISRTSDCFVKTSPAKMLNSRIKRTVVTFWGSIGHWRGFAAGIITPVPVEIIKKMVHAEKEYQKSIGNFRKAFLN